MPSLLYYGGSMAAMKPPSQPDAMAPGSQTGSSTGERSASGSSELKGARILLVEDSWHVGTAIKRLLHALGADVAGPAATIVDAERLVADATPDIAIVEHQSAGRERATQLIDRLHEQCIPVVVITGYTAVTLPSGKIEAVLQKPVSVEKFLAILCPIIARQKER